MLCGWMENWEGEEEERKFIIQSFYSFTLFENSDSCWIIIMYGCGILLGKLWYISSSNLCDYILWKLMNNLSSFWFLDFSFFSL